MKAHLLDPSSSKFDPKFEKLWDQFALEHQYGTIHQSTLWAHFKAQATNSNKYWLLLVTKGAALPKKASDIIGGSIIIRQALPRGYSWLYCPRGPLLDYDDPSHTEKAFSTITKSLKSLACEEKAIFLRVDPPLPKNHAKFADFHPVKHGFQPENTLIIDLQHEEKAILEQMKPKGRYNIRLADRKGVKVHEINPQDVTRFTLNMESFYDILEETTERDGFSSHCRDFYRLMLETLIPTQNATLYLAEYRKKIIAGIIVTFYGKIATYYYGASSNDDRNVMAPYLLQWRAMQAAKENGCDYYDLFGIAPPGAKHHPWAGVTSFKKKFGGQHSSYLPAHEYPFHKPLYWLYRIYKRFRH